MGRPLHLLSAIDPLLQGLTQEAAGILDPTREVNPLCNWWFTGASSVLIMCIGWFITDKIVEPRLKKLEIDGDEDEMPKMEEMTEDERRGLWAGFITMVVGVAVLVIIAVPSDSPLRAPDGDITAFQAPLMKMIVPLIFMLFLLPGIVHGYVSKTFTSHLRSSLFT